MVEFLIEFSLLAVSLSVIYYIFESNKFFTMLIFSILGMSLWYLWYLIPISVFCITGTICLLIALLSKPEPTNGDLYQALKNLSKHRNSINI